MNLFFKAIGQSVVGLLLLALVMVPVSADVHVDDITVSKAGGEFNIRLQLSNLGTQGVKGPILAELHIKGKFEKEWHLLKSWDNIPGLPPSYKAVRDFFISENADSALQDGFVLKAVIRPPHDKQVEGARSFGPGMWGGDSETKKTRP